MQPVPYTNAIALKRTMRRLIKALLDANPAPPSGSTASYARNWLSSSSGDRPVAVNAWMRRTLTDDSLGITVVTLTPANALAYAELLDEMVDDLAQSAQPSDPTLADAWAWLTADVGEPNSEVPPSALDFVGDSLPA